MNPQDQNQPTVQPAPPVQPVVGGVPPTVQPPVYQPMPSGSRRPPLLVLAIPALVALLIFGIIGAGALFGHKNSDSDNSALNDYSATDNTTTTDSKKVVAPTKTAIDQSFTTDFTYSVHATELVRNFAPKYPTEGKEVVLVKVTISDMGSKYSGGSPYVTNFKMVAGGQEYEQSYAVSDDELAAAGYTQLVSKSATKDAPNIGYLSFEIPTGTDKLVLRLKQEETKVIGGSTIPKKDYDITLN